MNLAQFDNIVTRLNGVATDLNQYNSYIQEATAALSLTNGQLAVIGVNAALRIAESNEQLANVADSASGMIADMIANATAAIAVLSPLLVTPTNLAECITWITSAIEIFAGPSATYTAQLAIFAAQSARITAAVASVTSALATTVSDINAAIAAAESRLGV